MNGKSHHFVCFQRLVRLICLLDMKYYFIHTNYTLVTGITHNTISC